MNVNMAAKEEESPEYQNDPKPQKKRGKKRNGRKEKNMRMANLLSLLNIDMEMEKKIWTEETAKEKEK